MWDVCGGVFRLLRVMGLGALGEFIVVVGGCGGWFYYGGRGSYVLIVFVRCCVFGGFFVVMGVTLLFSFLVGFV